MLVDREDCLYLQAMRIFAGILITVAAFSFALGISLPLLELKRLFFLTDTPSLVAIVTQLFRSNDYVLAIIVGAVSILFPSIKILAVAAILSARDLSAHAARRVSGWLGTLSKWSMLDVVLVALTIFAAKTSGLAAAFSQPGLWFFTLSTLASAGAAAIVKAELSGDKNKPPTEEGGGARQV